MNNIVKQLDLPVYRGKSIKTKQYVEGYLKPCADTGANIYWIQTKKWVDYQVEPESLSISFPGMVDSNNERIFASLSEDEKGGDKIIEDGKYEDGFNPVFNPYFRKNSFSIEDLPKTPYGQYELHKYKVIGIQE